MQCAARSSGRVRLNEPRNDLARGVRELATITTSLINDNISDSRGSYGVEIRLDLKNVNLQNDCLVRVRRAFKKGARMPSSARILGTSRKTRGRGHPRSFFLRTAGASRFVL